jgi:ADP-heptose:LPS heptosyltransferase
MNKTILFEPWGLGDAVIAASVMHIEPDRYLLACNSRWHGLLAAAGIPQEKMIALDLAYATYKRKGFYDLNQLNHDAFEKTLSKRTVVNVLSIRGDFRDLLAARRLFPKARVKITGWKEFFIRRSRCLDFPFSAGMLEVRNRYEAWAEITGNKFDLIKDSYAKIPRPDGNNICIHIGAQRQSRQYPFMRELKEALTGREVTIIAGPTDPLPEGIGESDVKRFHGTDFVTVLKQSHTAIVNDSGPMHMAAFLGCRTMVAVRTANIREWIPPHAVPVCSSVMPKGYRPDKNYASDNVISGWPSVEKFLDVLG